MPNIGGQGPFKRRIISAILTTIMLYACTISVSGTLCGDGKEDIVLGVLLQDGV